MEKEFSDLRNAICGDSHDLIRFRQLVINSIMATDIADKKLKELRNARWEKAFSTHQGDRFAHSSNAHEAVNCKATIVIEHLIQASDIAHTMQHW